jgi:hypothetical protein
VPELSRPIIEKTKHPLEDIPDWLALLAFS